MIRSGQWHQRVAVFFCLVALATACSPPQITPAQLPTPGDAPAWPDLWARLQEQTPYPYTTSLPPDQETVLDGTYGKMDPRQGARPYCRRCMPYPAEGGLWLLRLDAGIYRIFSTRSLSGWRSLGSFAVSGNRLCLFNDPHCMEVTGSYRWTLDGDELSLEVIDDACADGFRATTFTNYPWLMQEAP